MAILAVTYLAPMPSVGRHLQTGCRDLGLCQRVTSFVPGSTRRPPGRRRAGAEAPIRGSLWAPVNLLGDQHAQAVAGPAQERDRKLSVSSSNRPLP